MPLGGIWKFFIACHITQRNKSSKMKGGRWLGVLLILQISFSNYLSCLNCINWYLNQAYFFLKFGILFRIILGIDNKVMSCQLLHIFTCGSVNQSCDGNFSSRMCLGSCCLCCWRFCVWFHHFWVYICYAR